MRSLDRLSKHRELQVMTNRQVIIRIDPKTKEEYLSGHCVCPNTWHTVKPVDGNPHFGCNQCGCEAMFIDGIWEVGKMSPEGFIANKELTDLGF